MDPFILENHQVAATQFQKIWRGYRARKALKAQKPVLNYSTREPLLILGNEPDPVFDHPKAQGHFVYVGVGGLANFRWIAQILGTVPNSPDDGYTHIPKLFIVDVAQEVEDFWNELKKVTAKSKTYIEFVLNTEHLFDRKDIVRTTVRFDDQDKPLHLGILGVASLENNPLFPDPHRYQFFRNVMAKLTFIPGNYGDERVWQYIKGVTDAKVPRYVYVSNIIECTAHNGMYGWGASNLIQSVLRNIVDFNPAYVIHARTTLARALMMRAKPKIKPHPNEFVIFSNAEINSQYQRLEGSQYIPLTKEARALAQAALEKAKDDVYDTFGLASGGGCGALNMKRF